MLGSLVALVLLSAGGCSVPARYKWKDLPRYTPGEPAQVRMTSQPGLYVVSVQQRHPKRSAAVEDTRTWLPSGTRLGFVTDERGHLIAYTQHQQFDLGSPRDRLKYVQWTTRQLVEPELVLFTTGDAGNAVGAVGAAYVGSLIDKAIDGRSSSNDMPQSQIDKRSRH